MDVSPTFGAANPVPKSHGTLCGTESLVIVGDLCNLWTAACGPLMFAAVLKVLPNNHLLQSWALPSQFVSEIFLYRAS